MDTRRDHPGTSFTVLLMLAAVWIHPACQSSASHPQSSRDVEPSDVQPGTLGSPLVVNGTVVPEHAIKRFLCFGLGRKQVEVAMLREIIDIELEMRAQSGEDISQYAITPEDVAQSLNDRRREFAERYPSLDFDADIRRQHLSIGLYRDQLATYLALDRLIPQEDPRFVKEIIGENTGEPDFVEDRDYMRSLLIDILVEWAAVEVHAEKLPAEVLLTLDGRPITVDEIYGKIEPHIASQDVDEARRFLALIALAEHDLSSTGDLLPLEGFERMWQSDPAHEQMLDQLYGFPSPQAFETWMRVIFCMRQRHADELSDDEVLASYLPRLDQVAGAGKVDCDVLLASAYDFEKQRWNGNGWAIAESAAGEVKSMLDEGTQWDEIGLAHPALWDPLSRRRIGAPRIPGGGYRAAWTHNQLVHDLDESVYSIFLRNASVAQQVFFEQEIGTIIGPVKGSEGYYFSRLNDRTPATSELDLNNDRHREFVEGWHLRKKLNERVHALLARGLRAGTVRGI